MPPRRSSSVPQTPVEEFYYQGKASFENLVALANYQERINDARKIVWRDRGEPVVQLPTLRACLVHAGKGGARSAYLAFSIRVSFNLFLLLIKLRRVPRARWFSLVRDAIFGNDCFQFASMMGTFAALYKFLLNALPLLFPVKPPPLLPVDRDDDNEDGSAFPSGATTPGIHMKHREPPQLSLSAQAQMALIRKRTRRWHSTVAGAISGGLALMCETRGRRVAFAQQIFVRGLQGTYNTYSEKWGISIPYGAVLVFSLACGQIMYAFFLRPDTLPPAYNNWILAASKASPDAFALNIQAVQEHTIDLHALGKLISRPDVTPSNLAQLRSLRARVLAGETDIPYYAPCYALHADNNFCTASLFFRFLEVARWMLPIYSALHFLPTLLFRWKSLRKDPLRVLARGTVGSLRSSTFLGMFVVICQSVFCIKHQTYERIMALPPSSLVRQLLPQALIDILLHKRTWWLSGFLTGLALLIEDQRRRAELAMYVLPKGLESLWIAARGRGYVAHTGNWGESVLAAVGMGMVMTIYQNDPQHLSGLVRRILYQFIGPN
ncbi:hypothetical protein FB45DRAFT_830570 [Roridomyces roridus]|uniref:Transmembrane protein 135 N-terminal domain-containing protein n=1 Tax=Roridomyces roridus TaxID=1738132 RepID=A0AAD7BZQ7_9AGAR|nr:hypothetical protein FB45DRAFT_830570 [Roridomyces roridus]